jgi:hypothetical protein
MAFSPVFGPGAGLIVDNQIVPFEYVYDGQRHRCGYRVVGDQLVVVVGEEERITELARMAPERLAHVIAHELLVMADFARRAGKP